VAITLASSVEKKAITPMLALTPLPAEAEAVEEPPTVDKHLKTMKLESALGASMGDIPRHCALH
jgi:hypothetical protein